MSRKVARALEIARRAKRAAGGEVSFEDRWSGEPYRETADDVATRARNLLHSQPQRMERIVPDKTDEVGGPLIDDGGQFSAGAPWANKAADIGSRVVRGMGEGILHDLSVPGAGMKPNPYPEGSEEWHWYNDQLQQAATQWGPSMALNTMGTSMPFAQHGAAGIFGGRLAQTADHAALARAEKMHAEGVDRRVIWNETGWFQGADGQWRFEIPDENAKFARVRGRGTIDNYPFDRAHENDVGSAFEHPELYKAYPDLAATHLAFEPLQNLNGYYRRPGAASPGDLIPPPAEKIGMNVRPTRYGADKDQSRSTMLHELQHAVQQREGFVPGSSPEAMPPEELAKIQTDPYNAYRRIAGEVEARNVQARRDFDAAQRTKPPWATEDIPLEKQLIGAPHDPAVQGSFSTSEYQTLQPWWQHEVAGEVGLESVPAQARLWTALGPQTGVESELGAPKLELLAKQIMTAAKRLRVSPETARDMVLSGRAGAGVLAAGMLSPAAIEMMRGVSHETEGRAAGGSVSSALQLARSIKRAHGGKVHTGAIMGDTDGRADEVPMEVPDGAYVLTADHVSSMGEGNTLAGFKKLDQMFPKSAAAHAARKTVKRASGGGVPIYAADGEYVICPEDITDRWGDLEAGHRYLDAWQTASRKEHVNTLRNLAPPAQD